MFVRGFTKAVERLIVTAGKRIQADFSNSVVSSRMLFQSFTKDSPTSVGVVPNGTYKYANFTAFTSSNPDQSALIQVAATETEMVINSARTGSADYLPLTFYTGGNLRLRVDISGSRLLYQESAGTFSTDSFQMNDASGSKQRALARQIINESGVTVASINQYINTDGSSTITFTGSRAGARNSYREVTDWTIDSAGRLQNTSKTMPHVWARRGTTEQTSGSTVLFDVVEENTGGAYNSSTGEFTVPVSGYYDFSVAVGVSKTSAGSTPFSTGLFRVSDSKGFGQPVCTLAGSNQLSTLTISGSAYLNAGDIIKVGGGGAFTADIVVAGGPIAATSYSHLYIKLAR